MIPGPSASKETVRGIARVEQTALVADGDERHVSALLSPGAETADGPLVLYVHGTPGDATAWADYLLDPVGGARAVAVDRPGFGRSDSRALATLEGQSRALRPYVESADEVIVVGHSYGGPVALQAALDWPERVCGVVVVAGSVSPELEKLRWFNYLAQGLRLLVPRTLRRANDEVWPLKADLQRLAEDLDDVRVPVAIVHGTEDSLVPYGNVAFMEETLVGVERLEVRTIADAGHFIIWQDEHVPTVRAAIEGLLPPSVAATAAAAASQRGITAAAADAGP